MLEVYENLQEAKRKILRAAALAGNWQRGDAGFSNALEAVNKILFVLTTDFDLSEEKKAKGG